MLVNLLFPPQCLTCDARVSSYGTLCAQCWAGMRFIAAPLCPVCGTPFEFALGGGEEACGLCIRKRPPYSRARAVLCYDDASRALIKRLKYGDDTRLAKVLAPWLALAGQELLCASDIIVPVPLHYWRFVKRRYNQAALLAQALSAHARIPCLPDALKRTRRTKAQTGLTFAERQKNMKGAFAAHPRRTHRLQGKSVLLLDDVYTTGATLRACTRALLDGGAAGVSVLTLARRV